MNTDTLQTGQTTRSTRPAFFCTSGPLAADRPGYIQRPVDSLLRAAIEGGTFANVVGAPMVGKTSLLFQTAQFFRQKEEAPMVALIDISPLAQRESHRDPARWLYAIAFRLSRQLRVSFDLQAWWSDNTMLSHQQRMLELFREFVLAFPTRQVILFFDDVDSVAAADAMEPLLGAIRLAFEARAADPAMARLSIVIAGSGDRQFNHEQARGLPFGIATRLDIACFTLGETLRLGPALGLPRAEAELAMQRIYDWASGQPAITQYLAHELAGIDCEHDVVGCIDLLVKQRFARQRDRLAHQVLLATESSILSLNVREREVALVTLGKIAKHRRALFDPLSATHDFLLRRGVLQLSPDGYLMPASRLSRQYFNAGWANRHLRPRLRELFIAAGVIAVMIALPLWYQEFLPRGAMSVLSKSGANTDVIVGAYQDLEKWPGYHDHAERAALVALRQRADAATSEATLDAIVAPLRDVLDVPDVANEVIAGFWHKREASAAKAGDRAAALAAAVKASVVPTIPLRQKIAGLTGSDLPLLEHVLQMPSSFDEWVFRRRDRSVVVRQGSTVTTWPMTDGKMLLQSEKPQTFHTVARQPLVNRFDVPLGTALNAIWLELQVDHQRPADLTLELTNPSGDSVRIKMDTLMSGLESTRVRLSDLDVLKPLQSGGTTGEWTLTVEDVRPGVSGRVATRLMTGTATDSFAVLQPLPDPLVVPSADVKLSRGGRYAVARPATERDGYSVWDVRAGRLIATYSGRGDTQWLGLTVSSRAAVLIEAAEVKGFRLRDGEPIQWTSLDMPVAAAWLSANGRWLAARPIESETTLHVVDVGTDTRRSLSVSHAFQAVVVSPSGDFVALLGDDRVLRLVRIADGTDVASYPLRAAFGGGFFSSSDRQFIVQGIAGGLRALPLTDDGVVSVWDANTAWQAALDADSGLALVGASERGFRLHDFDQGRDRSLPFLGWIGSDKLQPYLRLNANLAAIAEPERGQISFWRPSLAALPLGSRFVRQSWLAGSGNAFAFIDRNEQFAVMRLDAGAGELDILEEDVSMVSHSEPPSLVRFSPGGKFTLSVERSGLYRVRDVDEGQFFDFLGRVDGGLVDAAFSPDSQQFILLGSRSISVHDAVSGERLHSEFRDDAMVAVAPMTGGQGWLLVDTKGHVLYQAPVQRGQPASLVMRDMTLPTAPAMLKASVNGVLVGAIGRKLQVFSGRVQALQTIDLAGEITGIQQSDDFRYIVVRAGQWLHRLEVTRTGTVLTHSRLLPADTLEHQGFSIADREAMSVNMLGGLDEPELRRVSLVYDDQVPVDVDMQLLRKRWQWLSQLASGAGDSASSSD